MSDAEPTADATAIDLVALDADLTAVDAALARLDDGTYGTCPICQATIGDDLLAADPTRVRCDAHLI